jgi:hypothetical protein
MDGDWLAEKQIENFNFATRIFSGIIELLLYGRVLMQKGLVLANLNNNSPGRRWAD